MVTVILAMLAACGGNDACYQYCADRASLYPDLIEEGGADPTGLPGYGGGTEFSEDAYLDTCGNAPADRTCEGCTEWYYETFLEPTNITSSCDEIYGRADSALPDDVLAEMEDDCYDTCEAAGLSF